MLQIMENTWLTLGLSKLSDLPMNRGWVNVFRRWADTPAFQALWPYLRPEYGAEFVRFCEQELHLRTLGPNLIHIDSLPQQQPTGRRFDPQAEIAKLEEEFEREWAGTGVPPLRVLISRSRKLWQVDRSPPAWLIVQPPSQPLTVSGGSPGEPFVVGIVLAAAFDDIDQEFPGAVAPDARKFGEHDVEFVVWMRRGFRSANLAHPGVETLLRKGGLARALKVQELPTLWARYPKSGAHGDADHEHGVWLTFFARFDFRPVFPAGKAIWKGSLLKLQTPSNQVVRDEPSRGEESES
jgi:hypothetical protein